jgi:hypothetical protein
VTTPKTSASSDSCGKGIGRISSLSITRDIGLKINADIRLVRWWAGLAQEKV